MVQDYLEQNFWKRNGKFKVIKKSSTDVHHAEVIEAELFSQTLAENNFVW